MILTDVFEHITTFNNRFLISKAKSVGHSCDADTFLSEITTPLRFASLYSVAPRAHVRQRLKLIRAASLWFAAANLRAQKAATYAADIVTPYFVHSHVFAISSSVFVIIYFPSFILLIHERIDRIRSKS